MKKGFSTASWARLIFNGLALTALGFTVSGCMGPGDGSSSSSSGSSSSSSGVANDVVLEADNHYLAPRSSTAPVIDGQIDAVWADANWMAMTVAWTRFGLAAPSSEQDFSGKYKAMWTPEYLYVLVDITDDIMNTDGIYYQQDTLELFIDEDQSGGEHDSGHNAFAYHINYTGEVIDRGGDAELIASHITFDVASEGTRHVWEVRIKVYANHDGYSLSAQEAARVMLSAGKIMGFTPSYIDDDGNNGREHFMSSVDTEGHQNDQGSKNADSFGSIELVE